MGAYSLLVIVGFLILFWLWFSCLVDLMNRGDEDFAGRYDKAIWAGILVFLNIIGAAAYLMRKRVDREARTREAFLGQMGLPDPKGDSPVPCPECGKPMAAKDQKCPSCGWSYFGE